ncbi:MAG: Hpt domain-containing protein, partial [Gammaproteobacteria bacterium]|nr:Hpt domain-containing protein [Gammaproteobacteria bacterium]
GEQALKQETKFAGCPVLADDADPEILEIYLEEAAEEIASLTENIPQWIKQTDNAELLATLRRSLHTLKGSGRMAGAMRIGEFNHVLENLFNTIIDGSVDASGPVFALMSRVPVALQQLFDQLRDGAEPEIDLAEMVAHADALSRGEMIELPNPDDSAPVESCEEEFDACGDDQPAEEEPGNDAELLDIFTRECNEHLLMIEGFLDSNQAPCEVTEALYRSLHTIAGISASLNVSSINKLAAALENYFDSFYQGNHPAGTDALAVLRDSTTEMGRLLQQVPDMDSDTEPQQQLCARIEALPLTVEAEPPTAEAEPPAAEEEPAEDPFASVDSEILEIFMEEASEIIDAGEDTLCAWSEEPENHEFMVEYQRQLHTLKGGARMVDITPIGDLSHTLESLLTRVVEGQLEVTPE